MNPAGISSFHSPLSFSVRALCEQGQSLLDAGRFPEALQSFAAAQRVEPAALPALLGEYFCRRREVGSESALGVIERTARFHPDDFTVLRELGRSRREALDLAGARAALERAVESQPDDAAVRYLLGMVCMDLGDFGEAERELRTVLRLDPAQVDPKIRLGRLYLAMERFGPALIAFEAAAEDRPFDPAVLEGAALAAEALEDGPIPEVNVPTLFDLPVHHLDGPLRQIEFEALTEGREVAIDVPGDAIRIESLVRAGESAYRVHLSVFERGSTMEVTNGNGTSCLVVSRNYTVLSEAWVYSLYNDLSRALAAGEVDRAAGLMRSLGPVQVRIRADIREAAGVEGITLLPVSPVEALELHTPIRVRYARALWDTGELSLTTSPGRELAVNWVARRDGRVIWQRDATVELPDLRGVLGELRVQYERLGGAAPTVQGGGGEGFFSPPPPTLRESFARFRAFLGRFFSR